MATEGFKWWWEDAGEMALWEKLNGMNYDTIDEHIKQQLIYKYGRVYFFKPHPQQKPVLECTSTEKFVQGQNSSGKSYGCGAADTAYEVIRWSPYREVPKAKYNPKIIWVFSPTFDLQKASALVHLFNNGNPDNIGLLPSYESIVKYGGKVYNGAQGSINSVLFNDGAKTELHFKTGEMSKSSLSAAGIDYIWYDEYCNDPSIKEELTVRLVRKNGRMIMTFLYDPQESTDRWVINDYYLPSDRGEIPEEEVKFFFLDIDNNDAMSQVEKDMAKKRVRSNEDRAWRFSEKGKFLLNPMGDLLYEDFDPLIHCVGGMFRDYNPMSTIYRSWDLGFKRPACLGVQLDKNMRRRYLFSYSSQNILLTDFIDEVVAFCKNNFPDMFSYYELLPHDVNSTNDMSPERRIDIFRKKGLTRYQTTWNRKEGGLDKVIDSLRYQVGGIPRITIDPDYARDLCETLSVSTRNKKGEMRRDGFYEHFSDCLKQAESYFYRIGSDSKKEIDKNYYTNHYSKGVIP